MCGNGAKITGERAGRRDLGGIGGERRTGEIWNRVSRLFLSKCEKHTRICEIVK